MRRLVLGLILGVGCSKNSGSGRDCIAGQVYADNGCVTLCENTCPAGYDCDVDRGFCAPASRKPQITGITGDGDPNTASTEADNHIRYGLIIDGANLENATNVALSGTGGLPSFASLLIRANTATRLEVELPDLDSVAHQGTYVLSVTNALGTAQATFPIMRGDLGPRGPEGPAGTCSDNACYRGAARVTSFSIRGVNPAGGAVEQSLRIDGSEQIAVPADGVYFAVLNRDTHQFVTNDPEYNRRYDLSNDSDHNILLLKLDLMPEARVVVLVSRGDVSADLNQVLSNLTLAGEMRDAGASETVSRLAANQAFAFVGAKGLGVGNGVLVVSPTGVAEAFARLVDGIVAGDGVVPGEVAVGEQGYAALFGG